MEFTAKDRSIIRGFLNNPGFIKSVELDCGHPIDVAIPWKSGVVTPSGPIGSKSLRLDQILLGCELLVGIVRCAPKKKCAG